MERKIVCAEQCGHVQCGSHIAALFDLKRSVDDLDLAGPFCLIARYLDLGAGSQLGVILFGACHVVEEVAAVHILGVYGSLVLPPGLLCLYVGFYNDLGVQLCRCIFRIGHNALGLYGRIVCCGGGFGFRFGFGFTFGLGFRFCLGFRWRGVVGRFAVLCAAGACREAQKERQR